MLSVSEEERRASDTVLFTSENDDIANQRVDTSFFSSEKSCMTNQLASLARRGDFYLDAFWLVNLGMYIITVVGVLEREHWSSLSVKNLCVISLMPKVYITAGNISQQVKIYFNSRKFWSWSVLKLGFASSTLDSVSCYDVPKEIMVMPSNKALGYDRLLVIKDCLPEGC